jgi:hypothetical protein
MRTETGIHLQVLVLITAVLWPIATLGAPQDPPSAPVTVVNTTANPLPVTGTVNVGNLGATTLPVSVTNFPATQAVSGSVTVSNFPTVQSVSVTNSSTAPVLARVLNAPGSNPFVGVLTSSNTTHTVPATVNGLAVQSLAITQISGGCTGIGSFALPLQDAIGGSVIASFVFQVGTLQNGFFHINTQQTQIYIPTGHSVVIGDNTPPHGCRFDLSGYYVTQ